MLSWITCKKYSTFTCLFSKIIRTRLWLKIFTIIIIYILFFLKRRKHICRRTIQLLLYNCIYWNSNARGITAFNTGRCLHNGIHRANPLIHHVTRAIHSYQCKSSVFVVLHEITNDELCLHDRRPFISALITVNLRFQTWSLINLQIYVKAVYDVQWTSIYTSLRPNIYQIKSI